MRLKTTLFVEKPLYIEQQGDILTDCYEEINLEKLTAFRERAVEPLVREHWAGIRAKLAELAAFAPNVAGYSFDRSVVSVGEGAELSQAESGEVSDAVNALIPWRKGPFDVCGVEIDAEWRSDLKWARLEPHLGELRGRRICDVGCNNGYFLYRLLQHEPRFVLGLDPSERAYYQFALLQEFARDERLQFELAGVEDMDCFSEVFDVIFCLGVLYHRRDPLTALQHLRAALRPGGRLFVESLVIPGEESVALFPRDRYQKMRNVYHIPTVTCLESWLARAGFSEIEVLSVDKTTEEEQRQTRFSPYESLREGLAPGSLELTVEGYPGPVRAIVVAKSNS